MNREEIIRMAREAGFNPVSYTGANLKLFERFAALVAAAEREACIKAVEKVGQHGIVTQCAAAIRYKKHDIGLSEERDRVWTQAHWTEYERSIAAAEREKAAAWMIARGYATGHGDSVEDLLQELDWQIREQEREACAKACEQIANELSNCSPSFEGTNAETKWIRVMGETIGNPFVEAIRARGQV